MPRHRPLSQQPPSQRRRTRSYQEGVPQGERTRHWKVDAPQRGVERNELYEKCGRKCFLIPSRKAFPVCSRGGSCQYDCRALASAKVRAAQYRYNHLLPRINRLLSQHC